MRVLSAALLVGAFLLPAAEATAAGSVFDAPLDMQTRVLTVVKDAGKATLTCSYYPRFMVKQIDEGEIGALQLSIVPIGTAAPKPDCQSANVPGEKVIDPSEWTGYFKGVKGDYVFFDAEDGVNNALGFAIFAAGDGKKLFEDSAFGYLHGADLEGPKLVLRYQRSFTGPCSVPHDGAACWTRIAAATGLDSASKPDCAAGYLKAKTDMAIGRCEGQSNSGTACLAAASKELDSQRWDEAPSVIVYETETTIQAGHAATKPLGGAVTCHPSD